MTDDTTDLRLECICTTVSILSSGVDESTMSGVGKLLTRCLEETLSGRRYMATGAIIDVLCREDGPIARFHVSNSQNALYIRVLGVTTTWHPRAAAPNRKKIFTCLLQRVSIHQGLNESEIEKCNMQARNGIKGAISMIDIEASLSDPTISRRIEWGISHVGATSTTNPPPAAPDRAAKKAIAKLKIAEMIDEMKKGLTEDFDEKFMVNTEKIMVAVTQQMDQKVDKNTWEQSNAKRAKLEATLEQRLAALEDSSQASGRNGIVQDWLSPSTDTVYSRSPTPEPVQQLPIVGSQLSMVGSQSAIVGGAITNPYVSQQHPEFAFFDFTKSERQWFVKPDVIRKRISEDPLDACKSLWKQLTKHLNKSAASGGAIVANAQHSNRREDKVDAFARYHYTLDSGYELDLTRLVYRILKMKGFNSLTVGLAHADPNAEDGATRLTKRPYSIPSLCFAESRLLGATNVHMICHIPDHTTHDTQPGYGLANKMESALASIACLVGMSGQANDGGANVGIRHEVERSDGAVYLRYSRLSTAEMMAAKANVHEGAANITGIDKYGHLTDAERRQKSIRRCPHFDKFTKSGCQGYVHTSAKFCEMCGLLTRSRELAMHPSGKVN